MTIGAHVTYSGSLLAASLTILSTNHPEDHFIIFSAAPLADLPANCTPVMISPKPANRLLLFYWYNYRLPGLLKKYNADLFISEAGLLSIKSELPQYLYFSDDRFEAGTVYFKKNFKSSLLRAKKIFTTETFIAEALRRQYHVPEEKTQTIYYGFTVGTGHNLSGTLIKEKFTGGDDYFICPVTESAVPHLIVLLKAYSELKNRQKTAMKLVLLNTLFREDLIPGFNHYKYRDDVKIIPLTAKNALALFPNAYAMISLSDYFPGNDTMIALANGIPLIVKDNVKNRSLFGEAALYAPVSETALSEKMQLLYKDEHLKNSLAEKGTLLIKRYDAQKTASALWDGLTDNISALPLKKIPAT